MPTPGFNHNDFYHPHLLQQLPNNTEQALDVGCGTGTFARKLAHHATHVEAIDQSPAVIERAAKAPNITFTATDLNNHQLKQYDFISCIASIHHMPFEETIERLIAALRPHGVLAIIGCYKQSTIADYLPDLVAAPANLLANLSAKHLGRPATTVNDAPVKQATMTLPQIKRAAPPSAIIKRRLFWRYTLVYTNNAPGSVDE